ncbi:helix-turn-helix domain-containing protein [Marinicrinis lubricantis]|uniref:Helix-turn-helix domain-containing protein n=1 Tax=Marinicrinis lubricantis TaxID=2086470 RepID=A0ABW1IVY0_9BACL
MLLVDPDQYWRKKTQHMPDWKDLGFSLEDIADTAEDALALFRKQPFSLVLISMKEEPTDGIALCAKIRYQSLVPIILMGGSRDFYLVRKAMSYQVFDYLPDSFHPNELVSSLESVKRVLDSDPLPDQQHQTSQDSRKLPDPPAGIIDKVKEYVSRELHQHITLKQISDKLHYNCAYLGQKFKTHENMTFNEYLLIQRMEKAKLLLERTNMKVYEVAKEVGYTEMDWFYKKFKTYTGVSANMYRKKYP